MEYDTKALIAPGVTFVAAGDEHLKAAASYGEQELLRRLNDSIKSAVEDNLKAIAAIAALKAGFDSSQPRVPRGNPDGGEWTDGGGGSGDGVTTGRIREALRTRTPGSFERIGTVASNSRDVPMPEPMRMHDAVKHLETNAKPHLPKSGEGECARYVREALNAGGYKVGIPPRRPGASGAWAKDYGPELTKPEVGFHPVVAARAGEGYPLRGYTPQKGDVVIIQSTSRSKEGHMAMYSGGGWVSDFKQKGPNNGFWPGSAYLAEKPSYVIYRAPEE